MKKLLWKELYEQRFIPLAYGVLLSVTITLVYIVSAMNAHQDRRPTEALSVEGTLILLGTAICISGLFPGVNAIAPEVGQGTLGFLTQLPGSRPKLWRAKVGAGMLTIFFSLIALLVCYSITTVSLFGGSEVLKSVRYLAGTDSTLITYAYIPLALFSYAISLFFSTVVDRTITAGILSIIGGLALLIGLMAFLSSLSTVTYLAETTSWELMALVFVTIGLFISSHLGFSLGDSLKSSRHVSVAVGFLFIWLTAGSLGLEAYSSHMGQLTRNVSPNIQTLTIEPKSLWQAGGNVYNGLTLPGKFGWVMASVQCVPVVSIADVSTGHILTPDPHPGMSIPADSLQLMEKYHEALNSSTSYGGSAPDYIKNNLVEILKSRPHFFLAEYRMASWYADCGQMDEFYSWRNRALADAPRILAGRVQYENGKPIAGAKFQVGFNHFVNNDQVAPTPISYDLITDKNGCYYLPVFNGFYEMSDFGWTGGPQDIVTKIAANMSFEHDSAGLFKPLFHVGVLPEIVARPYMTLTGPAIAKNTSSDKPVRISSRKLDISWQPYQNADFYLASLQQIHRHGRWGEMGYMNVTTPKGFDDQHPLKSHLLLNLAGHSPEFKSDDVYYLQIAAYRGIPGHSPQECAVSRNFYFALGKANQ